MHTGMGAARDVGKTGTAEMVSLDRLSFGTGQLFRRFVLDSNDTAVPAVACTEVRIQR